MNRALMALVVMYGTTCFAAPPAPKVPDRRNDPTRTLQAPPKPADDAPDKVSEFPDNWYIHDPTTKLRYPGWEKVEGQPAKFLRVSRWYGEEQDLEKLKGKVVVVYFWSTECGPCLNDLRDMDELAKELHESGAAFFTIHDDTSGAERLPALIRQFEIDYPIGIDRFDVTAHEWEVRVHPLYAVVDAEGIVRALGIKPKRLRELVTKLQAEQSAAQGDRTHAAPGAPKLNNTQTNVRAEIPDDWLEGSSEQRATFAKLLGKAPPALNLDQWLNSEPLSLESLKGKVVMLDFWATWCAPCRAAVPKMIALNEKYGPSGLVIIGVCNPKGVENMRTVAEQLDMDYPLCADTEGKVTEAYSVNSFPDYYFIDRSGKLRIADCKNGKIEDAIQALLNEPAPVE